MTNVSRTGTINIIHSKTLNLSVQNTNQFNILSNCSPWLECRWQQRCCFTLSSASNGSDKKHPGWTLTSWQTGRKVSLLGITLLTPHHQCTQQVSAKSAICMPWTQKHDRRSYFKHFVLILTLNHLFVTETVFCGVLKRQKSPVISLLLMCFWML